MITTGDATDDGITIGVRADVSGDDLNALFAASWPGFRGADFTLMLARSLTWVTAHRAGRLIGFVNVATDGAVHAFLLNTTVHPDFRRLGVGVRLVNAATDEARAMGAHWLHVDYEDHLESFYRQCGFRPTAAGLINLRPTE